VIVSEKMGMKYFFHSIFILFIVSIIAGCERKPEGPVAVQINERAITLEEFKAEVNKSLAIDPEFTGTPEDREGLIEELITRELLIQEAMRMGLDREEEFRRQIRGYYEQTLIQELMRMKLGDIPVDVSEEEIKELYELMGKVYHLDIAEFDVLRGADGCPRTDEDLWQNVTGAECRNCHEVNVSDDMEVMLEYLPRDFSNAVRNLRPGEVSGPVPLGDKSCFVKLGEVQEVSLPPYSEVRDQIRTMLERQKKADRMERWLRDLREKADIDVNRDVLDKEK
jgi:peptidyl-prolyl cis-trans isomerase C